MTSDCSVGQQVCKARLRRGVIDWCNRHVPLKGVCGGSAQEASVCLALPARSVTKASASTGTPTAATLAGHSHHAPTHTYPHTPNPEGTRVKERV
ncbi:hypothetical protein E2C01_067703 [Portunus trituberculatus]|uniref:Uncharacterized protein n=1 Tax=Portunus trituberculatus TaxID=210409 RepID=A0A5B7HUH3_PORTR|nr:hypothetical protein [Portunus trituberculatus]